ncbi:MAG: acetylxylan esterase [Alistipes sp.]|nr:acetylxylan esterase [Alistipes sp.]
MKKLILSLFAAAICSASLFAAPAERFVKVVVTPDNSEWRYDCGQKPVFTVTVLKHNNPIENAVVSYEISEDMMKPHVSKTLTLKNGTGTITLGTMKVPGFLRCRVFYKDGDFTYEGTATAGFEPEKIRPTTTLPDDFDKFWSDAVEANGKLPLEPVITPMPELCTGKADVYHISFQNYTKGSRFYGILCVPVGGGKHPAILAVPGAGVRGYRGMVSMAEQGYVTLQVGIHGIPVNLDPKVYTDLYSGALRSYNRYRLDNRDQYYYKRVYLGCARAIDFLAELESVDAERIAVCGGSQGGALSITTAVLNPKVKYLAAYYPALCDMTGYLYGRGGGWPHLFSRSADDNLRNDKCIETTKYYDVVNFARKVNIPVFMSMGYNDMTCCPTSTMSAYNVISSEKELLLFHDTKHYTYTEQDVIRNKWLYEHLGK